MTESNSYTRVREFMDAFGHPVFEKPTRIDDEGWEKMRLDLIIEEVFELIEAMGYDAEEYQFDMSMVRKSQPTDVIETADALGDIEYVVNGLALGMGIDLPAVVQEVHRSNMTKLGADGKPIYREDGKILKGPDFEQPNLKGVLGL